MVCLKVLKNMQNILELSLPCCLRYSKRIFKLFPNYSYRVPLNASYPTLQSFVSPSHHLHMFTCTMYKINIRIFLSHHLHMYNVHVKYQNISKLRSKLIIKMFLRKKTLQLQTVFLYRKVAVRGHEMWP